MPANALVAVALAKLKFNALHVKEKASLLVTDIQHTKMARQDFDKIVGKGTDGYEQRTGWLHKDGMTLLYYHKD